jgi:UDP-N-acetylmuramoyl-L-alanyl-D-glutamate--2,6-diaminopimelate ligase
MLSPSMRLGHLAEGVAGAAVQAGADVDVRAVPLPAGTSWLRLADSRLGLGELGAVLHGRPSRRLRVVGVTGTAGKSTTTHLTASALDAAGLPAGYLSSVALRAGGPPADSESGQTTLEAPDVQAWLARMAAEGARAAAEAGPPPRPGCGRSDWPRPELGSCVFAPSCP